MVQYGVMFPFKSAFFESNWAPVENVFKVGIINRPGVAGAVLQTPPLIIH